MTTQTKAKIMEVLSDYSTFLTLFAGLPYAFGDVANAFPPVVKKYIAVAGLSCAAATKFTQYAIQFFATVTPSSSTQPQAGAIQQTIK